MKMKRRMILLNSLMKRLLMMMILLWDLEKKTKVLLTSKTHLAPRNPRQRRRKAMIANPRR